MSAIVTSVTAEPESQPAYERSTTVPLRRATSVAPPSQPFRLAHESTDAGTDRYSALKSRSPIFPSYGTILSAFPWIATRVTGDGLTVSEERILPRSADDTPMPA